MSKVYNTQFIKAREVAEGTVECTLSRPEGFDYKAGQYAQIRLLNIKNIDNKGDSRVFSFVSSPTEENLVFAFRKTGTAFKKSIETLQRGDELEIDGPYGFYTFPESMESQLVFVAGGIGVTPYISMLRFAVATGARVPITMLYANKTRGQAAYLNELTEYAQNDWFDVVVHEGVITRDALNNLAVKPKEAFWHIAGPPEMVEFVRSELIAMGVPHTSLFAESFTGY